MTAVIRPDMTMVKEPGHLEPQLIWALTPVLRSSGPMHVVSIAETAVWHADTLFEPIEGER